MNQRRHYSRIRKQRTVFFVLLIVIAMMIGFLIGSSCCRADDGTFTCWAICKPGSYVELHIKPNKTSQIVGRLDPCDHFTTDGITRNGFLHVLDVGESVDSWIYSGFVATEKPEALNGARFLSVSKGKLYCRRWIGGPVIKGRIGYLTNCETVQVFYRTSEWCVTNRGYVRSEWLEADP